MPVADPHPSPAWNPSSPSPPGSPSTRCNVLAVIARQRQRSLRVCVLWSAVTSTRAAAFGPRDRRPTAWPRNPLGTRRALVLVRAV
mmetsp:Transcript_131369/g.227426  ORF Transcript_131369/g.227426 Transcript_131369/m.227426 type:complete len:86 (+) Transcript_131369:354-611(+)